MNIIINNFTKFSLEKIKDDITSKAYKIEIDNLYFKYKNENIIWENIELKNVLLEIERLLRNKLEEPKKINFKNKQISLILYPRVYDSKEIIDMQIFLKNNEEKYISDYILTFEKEDIIMLYVYLCKTLGKPNQINKPEHYKYMFLFVRYLEIDNIKQFCYISDDETIRIGDYVLVDRAGVPSIAIVEKIEYHQKEDSPFPFEKTKEIIRRIDKKELKQENSQSQEETQESYITLEEFEELKKNFNSLKDIIKNTKNKLHIKELMKQIARDNIYLDVFYNKKLNIFIGKINDVYFLDKYGKVIFTKKELKEMVKNSIIIEPNPIKDLSIIYNCALEICKNENIEYIDNFENIQEIIDLSQIKIEKIIDNNTHKEEDVDYFYQYICKKTYDNIKLYVRDMELSNEIITLYQNNIGKTIKEKSFVDCTKKIGGLVKNTRTYIISNSIEDFSLFEQDTNYGLCVANENSYFKIIDVQTVENKNYIILLQLDKDTRHFLENISTNIDIEIKNIGKEQFQKDIKSKHLEELDDNWYKRLFFPIGINKNGEIIQNHE